METPICPENIIGIYSGKYDIPSVLFLRDSAAKILWQAMELITIQKKNCSRKVTIYTSICHGADCHTYTYIYIYVYTDWWFGTFFIVPNSWDDDPI